MNWRNGPSPHMPKAQPNIQLKAHIFYYFQCGAQGFSPLIITSSSEYFLIHSMLFFQHSQHKILFYTFLWRIKIIFPFLT